MSISARGEKTDRSIVVIPATSNDPTDGSRIRYLLLLNIGFKESIPLEKKIKALGGKYEHIKNIVQENSVPWADALLRRCGHGRLVRPVGGKGMLTSKRPWSTTGERWQQIG
jgi:hypothetical protein